MALIICAECGKEFSNKANACPVCGCPLETKMTQYPTQNTVLVSKMENETPKEEVIKHLKYAKELEVTIYTYTNTWNRLQKRIDLLGYERDIPKPKLKKSASVKAWIVLFFVCLVLSAIVVYGFFDLESPEVILFLALGAVVGLYAMSTWAYRRQFFKEYKEYDIIKQKDLLRVENEEKMIDQLEGQQVVIQQQINANTELLQKLYSLNVIHSKYRNMVAVITILEYLETGRCYSLTGNGGAYDKYEYDIKIGTVISQLDKVISLLKDIRKSQYMLYEAIQEGNAIAEQICQQIERMLDSNGKIAENSALTAYNTDIIRRNTSISAYIDVFSKI